MFVPFPGMRLMIIPRRGDTRVECREKPGGYARLLEEGLSSMASTMDFSSWNLP